MQEDLLIVWGQYFGAKLVAAKLVRFSHTGIFGVYKTKQFMMLDVKEQLLLPWNTETHLEP